MKIISYSLFKGPDPLAELFYVRGFYFNVLMNSIVYPNWKMVVHVDDYIANKYYDLLACLVLNHSVAVHPVIDDATHCMKMLWRMKPVFSPESEYVICRDADALTSMREAKAVENWTTYNKVMHGIHDNPAHSIPLLGGMCGFKCDQLRDRYRSFNELISRANRPIDKHGSDQYLLNDVVYDNFKDSYICDSPVIMAPRLHPSDLCTSFIGAAGCNEMETLRYLRGVLSDWGADDQVLALYPKLFYWI